MKTAADVTAERKSTHGEWSNQSHFSSSFKYLMRDTDRWEKLTPSQQEALDMIATKISRILTGNPNELDHWVDIEGYAFLARKDILRLLDLTGVATS